MSYEPTDDFTPDRDRVADAAAVVPVIDIAPFASGDTAARRTVVDAVKHACEHVGFFVITGHGVSDETIRAVFAQWARVLRPSARREACASSGRGPASAAATTVWPDRASASRSGKQAPPDLMESLGFGPLETDDDPYWTEGFGPVHAHPNLWPEDVPEFRRAVSEYWRAHGSAVGAAYAHLRACARS